MRLVNPLFLTIILVLGPIVFHPISLAAEDKPLSRKAISHASFERKTFERGVGKLSLLQRNGEGEPLVLLPGTFSDATQWSETVPYLPEDLPLILIEMRGQGESWPPKPDNSIEELAQDTLWVLWQLGVERFHVGGHSLGGMVALQMGYGAPEKVRSVISVEGWTHHLVAKEAFGGVIRNTLTEDRMKERAEERAQLEAKWGKDKMVEFAQVWKRWDGSAFLDSTELPVLEIWGDRGMEERPALEQLRIPDRPNIRLEWIKDASHNLPTEKPEELGRMITEFLVAQ